MTTLFYFSAASKEAYSPQALIDYVKDLQASNITSTANALGVSATAIAGAMAEENNDYWANHAVNVASDVYELGRNFTSDMWWDDYLAVGRDTGYAPSAQDKFDHPVYTDLGYGNFKMTTAIRLVLEHDSDPVLGQYVNNYAQLALDIFNQSNGVTARLYGYMIKEADAWFTSTEHNAYGNDWATLPQEIKDALYVTYVNLGPGQMQDRFNQLTANGTYPYEPIPAAETGGGLNHLHNASAIATAIGVTTGYGDITIIDNTSVWLQNAKQDNDQGAAYREALVKLRPFVVWDSIYEGGVEFRDNFTDEYLQDRTDMLAWKMQLRQDGVLPTPEKPDTLFAVNLQNTLYIDSTSKLKIELGGTEKRIVFGGDADDTINGFIKNDHLYGGDGKDTLMGNGGNDYLEGGQGKDTYIYNSGDGFDAKAAFHYK